MISGFPADGNPSAGKVATGIRAGRVQAVRGAVRRNVGRRRLVGVGQAEAAILVERCRGRRPLRRTDRAGRRHPVHSRTDDRQGHERVQRGPHSYRQGGLHVAACLENVSAVLRLRAGRLPHRVRPGPRSAS